MLNIESYPDLLFYTENNMNNLNPDVIEDLNIKECLSFFLNKNEVINIINIISTLCNKENIIARQEVALLCRNKNFYNIFSELYDIIRDLSIGFNNYSINSDNLQNQLNFLNIIKKYLSFLDKIENISEVKNSVLISKFFEYFNNQRLSQKFIEMKTNLNEIVNELSNISEISIDILTFKAFFNNFLLTTPKKPSLYNILIEINNKISNNKLVEKQTIKKELFFDCIEKFPELYPELFIKINDFCSEYSDCINEDILKYINQISFYLSMNEIYNKISEKNFALCLPEFSEKNIDIYSLFDLNLLAKNDIKIICNDINFNHNEGFYVLTGANGGGKTTFIRGIGICAVLFMSGCYIPAANAQMKILDNIFTHFTKDERFDDIGRLKDETQRIEMILNKVNENSLVLLNETFSSTKQSIAIELSVKYIKKFIKKGIFGMFVTHQHDIADNIENINNTQNSIKIINIVADIGTDQNSRTYKIVKNKTDKKSYSEDILEKYGLSKHQLSQRLYLNKNGEQHD